MGNESEPDMKAVIISNKHDLAAGSLDVDPEVGKEFAKMINAPFLELSAKKGFSQKIEETVLSFF